MSALFVSTNSITLPAQPSKVWTNTENCAWMNEVQHIALSQIHTKSIHLKQFMPHCPNTHRKPNSYLIPGSWCVCDKARNLLFSSTVFWCVFTVKAMKTKNVKNKDKKVFETQNRKSFFDNCLHGRAGVDFSILQIWSHHSPD